MNTTIQSLEQQLSKDSKKKVSIIVNNNKTTLLKLIKNTKTEAHLSIHRIFLKSPRHIEEAIVQFINGPRTRNMRKILRQFIVERLNNSDNAQKVNKKLYHKGIVYDLIKIFDNLNVEYFDQKLDLSITWFGRSQHKPMLAGKTLGQYDKSLKLIKINKILDHTFIPLYFISFVIFHEMLHHVIPAYTSKNGYCRYHHKVFKEREKQFKHYQQAINWENKYKYSIISF